MLHDYKIIPSPDSIKKGEKEKGNELKKILKTRKNNKIIKEKSSSIEDSIIRKTQVMKNFLYSKISNLKNLKKFFK